MDKKILVVDDAMFMRSIIRKILKEDGYTQVCVTISAPPKCSVPWKL